MLMTSYVLLGHKPAPTEPEIREALSGNLCRCTGYQNIVTSVLRGTAAMHAEKGA
jgi:carbon-monoxide dehydrogenase small subunit